MIRSNDRPAFEPDGIERGVPRVADVRQCSVGRCHMAELAQRLSSGVQIFSFAEEKHQPTRPAGGRVTDT